MQIRSGYDSGKLKSQHLSLPTRKADVAVSAEVPADSAELSRQDYADASASIEQSRTARKFAMAIGAALPLMGVVSGAPAAAAEAHAHVQHQAPVESLAKTEAIAPGTLILNDYFDNHSGKAHGEVVEESSRDVGFGNAIVRHQAAENPAVKAAERFYSRLDNRQFSPQAMRQFTYDYMMNRQLGSLQSATQELTDLTELGTKQSVLNLSRGWGKAQIMESLYERVRIGWDQTAHPQARTVGERRVRKLAPALGLDADMVLKGEGDSRARFQQGLLSLLDEAGADTRVGQAQADYDKAVEKFESQGNSVVVAAANSGRVLNMMALDAPTPQLAADFFRNRLANDQVTTVGATRWSGDHEIVADYTNMDPGIDLYADGQMHDAWGTSFATPRIASVMAELHLKHPEATSDQVEDMVGKQFSSSLSDYGAWKVAPALDEAKAHQWLSGGDKL